MAYTGFFLQSMGAVALWDSPFLVALFFFSAVSTGIALVLACSFGLGIARGKGGLLRCLMKFDLGIIALETLACAAHLLAVQASVLGAQSVQRLLVGDCSTAFILGFALCGLVAPAAIGALPEKCKQGEYMPLASALLVLAGGFCLRLALVEAGIHSSI